MPRNYSLGNVSNDITFEVMVATRGIVSTEVARKLSGSVFITQAKSVEPPNANGKGMITQRSLGFSEILDGSELIVFTVVRLDLVPQNEWDTMYENFSIELVLNGGGEGRKVFTITNKEKDRTSTGETMTGKIWISINN